LNSFTDAEKVDIRRFCGYPAYGASAAGMQSWRYFQAYGLLEFRLTNLSASEILIARRYLGTLTTMETAVPAAADNLDTDQASMWTRNRDELPNRLRLLDEWRRRLCGFLGIAAGPALSSGTTSLTV
jgi:hypothetical protein